MIWTCVSYDRKNESKFLIWKSGGKTVNGNLAIDCEITIKLILNHYKKIYSAGRMCFIWTPISVLVRFRDVSDNGTANVHQVLCKSRQRVLRRPWQWLDKRLGKKAWAVHGKSKLTQTKKGEKGEEQSEENAHHFLWHQGDCSLRTHPGRPNSQFHILLWRFKAIMWKCAKTSTRTWEAKELAVASLQCTVTHFHFQQGIFNQKKHDCRSPSTLPFSVSPI
jgi:hypothetical protein